MMGRSDVDEAAAELKRAADVYMAVIALPQKIGAKVRWKTNDWVWTRTGNDEWKPQYFEGLRDWETWPSRHIAQHSDWEVIDDGEAPSDSPT